jgi:uncharacterized protein (UPF0335 family)
MIPNNLEKKKARLEKENRSLRKEIKDIDKLMKAVGFEQGIETLKAAAEALIVMNQDEEEHDQNHEKAA